MGNKVPDFVKLAINAKKEAMRYAGTESVKFFQQSFRDGGFTGSSFQKWKDSRSPERKTMFKDGTLMRSIHKASESGDTIVVESDTPYSAIHNDGGTITVTRQMQKFFWAKYYETAGIQRGDKEKTWTNIRSSEKLGRTSMSKSNMQHSSPRLQGLVPMLLKDRGKFVLS